MSRCDVYEQDLWGRFKVSGVGRPRSRSTRRCRTRTERTPAMVPAGSAQDRRRVKPSGASHVNVRCRVVSNQVR